MIVNAELMRNSPTKLNIWYLIGLSLLFLPNDSETTFAPEATSTPDLDYPKTPEYYLLFLPYCIASILKKKSLKWKCGLKLENHLGLTKR